MSITLKSQSLRALSIFPASSTIHNRNYCYGTAANKKALSKLDISQLKRGRGGRSSFSGIVVTVFGSTGFLGRNIVSQLGRTGTQVIVPYRGEPYDLMDMKLAGDLGQILFHPFDLRDEKSLYKLMKYSNVVINCIGKDYETSNWKFEDIHIDGARDIARIARESGVEKFIHLSAMNAAEHPEPVLQKKGCKFLQTKWYGEQVVKDEFPGTIIFRPSEIYGKFDRFMRYYCGLHRRNGMFRRIPLWKKGADIVKQPVFVIDLAAGIVNSIFDESAVGQTYEAVGPKRYNLVDIIDYIFRLTRKSDDFMITDMRFSPAFMAKVSLFESILKYSPISWEKLDRESRTDVLTGKPGLEDLGVNLNVLEDRAPHILSLFKDKAYNYDPMDAFTVIDPPPVATS